MSKGIDFSKYEEQSAGEFAKFAGTLIDIAAIHTLATYLDDRLPVDEVFNKLVKFIDEYTHPSSGLALSHAGSDFEINVNNHAFNLKLKIEIPNTSMDVWGKCRTYGVLWEVVHAFANECSMLKLYSDVSDENGKVILNHTLRQLRNAANTVRLDSILLVFNLCFPHFTVIQTAPRVTGGTLFKVCNDSDDVLLRTGNDAENAWCIVNADNTVSDTYDICDVKSFMECTGLL